MGRFLIVVLVSCLLMTLGFGANLAIAQERTVGVSEGDWFKYTIAVDWISNDPNATMPPSLKQYNDIEWFLVTIKDVSGTNTTYQSVAYCKNGTEFTGVGSIDIETGRVFAGMAIAANLNANDVIYDKSFDHFPYSGLKINDTMTRTYPDGKERETNHAYFTMDNWNSTVDPDEFEYQLHHFVEMYWDRSAGIMVETIGNVTRSRTDGYIDNALFTFTIIDSNVWTISNPLPEFPTWASIQLVLIALTATIIFFKRRLLKTPKH